MTNNDNKKTVAVVMCTYNGEKYLREAIDSVIAQTYENWELVFWDNQSTDSTREIVESYRNPKIKYFYSPEHTSLGEGRNNALLKVNGDYVCFLDSDDVWHNSFINEAIAAFETHRDIGLAYTGYQYIGTKKGAHESGVIGLRDVASLLEDYDIALSGAVFKRSIQKDNSIFFDTSFNLIEDLDFFTKLCCIKPAFHIGAPLLFYRIHSDNLSGKTTNWHSEYMRFYKRLKEENNNDVNYQRGVESIRRRMLNSRFTDSFNANKSFWTSLKYAWQAKPYKMKLIFTKALVQRKIAVLLSRMKNND